MANHANRPTTPNHEVKEILHAIARKHLDLETLDDRGLDCLDFQDCGVANLRAALLAAFEAGRRYRRGATSTRLPTTTIGDLVLTIQPRSKTESGWASGRIGGFRFEALVFPAHALIASYEIGRSRISKLQVRRLDDDTLVYNWDRGLDHDAPDQATRQAVDTITAQLADGLYGPAQD